MSAADYWENRYANEPSRWSGNPNPGLIAEVDGLAAGTALELGCGQGDDAIWLAGRGWTVTAVDIAASALATAADRAGDAAITWVRADLSESIPDGAFDLVVATYLHSPVELERTAVLRRAAERVAPGGSLLVIGHAPSAEHRHADLQTADAFVSDLALPEDRWQLVTCKHETFQHAFREEHAHERTDAVVRFSRR